MLAARRRHASANSTFQQITGQVTSQAPGAPNRQEWRRFDLRFALVSTALGTGVLAAAGLWPANDAMAGCVDAGILATPNTVNCNTLRTTTDTTQVFSNPGVVAVGDAGARHYQLNDPDDTVVTITTDGEITGFGLAVTSNEPGAAIDVNLQGAISVDDTNNPTEGGPGVFDLTTDGGDITYNGNGSVIDNDGGNPGLVIDTGTGAGNITIGSVGSPVTPTYQGSTALSTNSGTGNQSVFLDGGTLVVTNPLGVGALATSTTGDINMVLTGNTSITTTVAPVSLTGGVVGNSSGGDVTIESDAIVGLAGFEFAVGIASNGSNGTAIDITQTGGTILATFQGIRAVTSGANTGISVTTGAGSLIDMLGGTGIFASQDGAAGGVTVTVNGDIEGAETGVDASITNAASPDNVVVTASGSIEASIGRSISATTVGTGNATVNLLAGATMEGGVLAQSTTGNAGIVAGNNVSVDGNSPGMASITAGGAATVVVGNDAVVSGSSGIVVDQTLAGGGGVATVVVGDNGTIVGDGLDAGDAYDGNGIFAGNQGTGATSVTTGTGTSVTGADNGIFVSQTDVANTNIISITTDGPVTGNGTDAFLLPPYTDAFVAAALPTTGLGIGVSNEGTGDIVVTAGDTVTGSDTGIQTLAAGGGNTGITATAGTVMGANFGANATSTGTGTITVTGAGNYQGGAQAGISAVMTGLGPAAGNDGIVISGTGTTTSTAGTAIIADIQNAGNDSDILITRSGAINGVTGGVDASTVGDGDVTVTVANNVTATAGAGIVTSAVDGATTITASAGTVSGSTFGANATSTGTGTITVTGAGNYQGGAQAGISAVMTGLGPAAGNDGIVISGTGTTTSTAGTAIIADIQNAGNDSDILINRSGAINGVTGGIDASTVGDGDVTVTAANNVTATAGAGIVTSAVDGATTITASAGTVSGSTFGANATSTGTGIITVTGAGNYQGGAQAGISAVMTGLGPAAGNDGIVISGTGTTTSTAGTAIIADIQNAANDSDILINRSGAINGATGGIDASTTGGGHIVVSGIGPVTTTTGTGVSAVASGGNVEVIPGGTVSGETGIAASTTGAGTVSVTSGFDVTGSNGHGIETSAVNGLTTITVNDGTILSDTADGINAASTGIGDIAIVVSQDATVTTGNGAGSGINAEASGTGDIDIDNTGLIEGFFAAIRGVTAAVGQAVGITNNPDATIQNRDGGFGDLAISVTGPGTTTINNNAGATITGRVSLGSGDDTFTNSGLWATTGVSDFGAGNDSVTNAGQVDVANLAAMAEITHFANLEAFTNASTGVIDMVDDNAPNVGDQLTIDGVYTGVPGSIIQMDLALVSGDPEAGSDLLILDAANPAQGTSDIVFNIVSTGVSATTANTNRVAFSGGQLIAPVTVVENGGNLTTSSGDDMIPLARSGLITYDLVSGGGDYQVVSQLDAGLAGGLLLPIPAALATVAFTTQRTPNPITATCIDPDNKPNAQGGWVRGLAGQFNTESAGTASSGGVTSELESDNRTRFKTLQGGFDHVWCNIDRFASTLHLGVTVGQTWGDSVQKDPDPVAGIFGTDVAFDTFFVGPYAAFTRGDFAAQAALRFDYHSLELSNPTVGVGADGLDVDAQGISGSTSMSYDFALASLTLTPDVGVNVSNTEIDSFEIAGGTVDLDDLWSVMGHVGVTARTEPLGLADNLFVVPFASATLYHEFIEHADGQIDIGGTVIEAESNRVGTFGQLGIGANAVRLGNVVTGRPTLFGGARFDLQVGERIEGATATVFGRVQF